MLMGMHKYSKFPHSLSVKLSDVKVIELRLLIREVRVEDRLIEMSFDSWLVTNWVEDRTFRVTESQKS